MNIRELGENLEQYFLEIIDQRRYSRFDKVIVSSEDDEILAIAEKSGAEILHRPAYLSTDTASTIDVIKHALDTAGGNYDFTTMLQVTSPLRTEHHIEEAFQLLEGRNADAVISVTESTHSPLWSNTLPPDNSMKDFINKDIARKQSQELPTYYQLNGAIYICRTSRLIEENSFFISDSIYAYEMDQSDSIDIDTELEFMIADQLKTRAVSSHP